MKSYFCEMKILAKLVLVLFITFLSTPTIVTLIERNTDVSLFYNFSEEEIHKEIKEVKADLKQGFDYPFLDCDVLQNSKIISENLSRHDKISEEIFSPPPELI
jgi:hypothetical protein